MALCLERSSVQSYIEGSMWNERFWFISTNVGDRWPTKSPKPKSGWLSDPRPTNGRCRSTFHGQNPFGSSIWKGRTIRLGLGKEIECNERRRRKREFTHFQLPPTKNFLPISTYSVRSDEQKWAKKMRNRELSGVLPLVADKHERDDQSLGLWSWIVKPCCCS